ncbi:heterokaryon incompatibility protein-domain-containing protein [Parachaetomium inaequale]|uniref:Heterokaryon incompatibility protein-domain-containing protein n=1 Tax=Parachaetomium inaequale TaxID=2588326 RepID=A0AAN6P737_9PEZI|nr:heterokaryon incompatibility protein-domain-containing protein [Parachaetomium inaequale]
MICAQCRVVLQCVVSNDNTRTTRSEPVEREQLRGDESPEPEQLPMITHHPTYRSLREAIDQRCSLCIAFWETLNPEQQSFLMHFPWPHKDSTSATSPGACTGFDGYPQRLAQHPGKHPIALTDHTRSPETLALAKRWVADCVQNHKKCNVHVSSEDGTWYPTRLLDLSRIKHDGTTPTPEQTVSLIETAKVVPAGRYTTLSHRWGPTEQLRLTKHTYPQLAEGVPLGSLPQLMQDAIFVSLELNIHYLWIDLLCIYQDQDDIADWQHESSLMNQVYSNTFCNISAGDANGCLESLFSPRDRDGFLPQIIELKTGQQDGETGLFRVYDKSYWRRSVSRALVNTRAWVLQERFLSPRVLQFDRRQVLWECLERSATETCPNQIPSKLVGVGNLLFKSLVPIVQTTSTPDERFSAKVRHIWTCLVSEYTACVLTIASDKLIAISGIAKHVAALLQDDYVAGMWRRHLEGELIWYTEKSSLPGKMTRPAKYRAPSWSWASIDGPVRPGWSNIDHSLIKVEEVHLEHLTDDVFGAVTRGWLRLRGALRQLQLVRNDSLNSNWGWASEWDMILEGVKVSVQEMPATSSVPAFPPEVFLDVFHEGFEEENANNTLFAMFARDVTSTRGEHAGIGNESMWILLLKLIDRETAMFERIGVAKTWQSAEKEAILKIQRPTTAPALPGFDYGNGMHSICVI